MFKSSKRLWLLFLAGSLLFLIIYLVVEALNVPILTDPSPVLNPGGLIAAVAGVSLLIADVLLPVPSSIVMVAHGSLFGVVVGTILSLIGRAGAYLFGYYIGKKSLPLAKRFISTREMAAADRILSKGGMFAIIVTRPLPILSETIAVVAGLSSVPLKKSLLAATAGSLPEALLFALTGAAAASFQNTSLVFVAILLVAGLFWAISTAAEKSTRKPSPA